MNRGVIKLKRIICLIFSMLLVLSFCSCKGKENNKVLFSEGKPSAVGDVFKMPKIAGGKAGAPILSEITKQASADDTVIISGEGFASDELKVYIYTQSTAKNGKKTEADFTVIDDNLIHVVIDKSLKYGMYGIYAQNEKGNSNIKFVNKPAIWYVDFSTTSAGETVSVYGENLATDNKNTSNVFLVADGKYCVPEITFADPYKVSFRVPDVLEDGKQYEIWIHNGHGGNEGFAKAEEKLTYSKNKVVEFKGKKIDVTKFGADPKDSSNDDTAAIKKAISSANDGDTIYFPKGAYLCSEQINITKILKFEGESAKSSVITTTTDLKGYLFSANNTPLEFTKLGFFHDSGEDELQSGFITIRGDSANYNSYKFKVTKCHFDQEVDPEYRSKHPCVGFNEISGVIIENNTFDGTVTINGYNARDCLIRNNEAIANLYVGPYYGQDTVMMTYCNRVDISNNKFIGKDAMTDGSGVFDLNDMTVGRGIVFQGSATDVYVSNNTFKAAGTPYYNAGELILLENLSSEYIGKAVAFDKNGFTVPTDVKYQASRSHIVSIVSGKGKHQYRRIATSNGKNVTVDAPWDIVPNEESSIVITDCYYNVAIHKNDFDGYANYLEEPGATCGLQIYGSAHNLFYTKNIMKNMPDGICVTPRYVVNDTGKHIALVYWCQLDDNYFEQIANGIRYYMVGIAGSGDIPMENSVGVTMRRNKFKDIPEFIKSEWVGEGGMAIKMGQADRGDGGGCHYDEWKGNWINGVCIENTTFENCEIASIYFFMHQGNTVLRNNTEDGEEVKYKIFKDCNGPIFAAK